MCKEKLKVDKDGSSIINGNSESIFSGNQGATILGSSANKNDGPDENCYFVDAKRIRVTVKNKHGKLEKKEVTVHMDCLE